MSSKLSQTQRQRFQFIESCLLWEGSVRRRDICEAFDLTLNHVTREITAYRKDHKDNLVYDPEARTWRIGPDFKPAYATGGTDGYLSMLHAYALGGDQSVLLTVGPTVAAQALPQVTGKIERIILKEIISALRCGMGTVVKYQSFSDPEPTDRILWPHALVYANERWHVRAYDSLKGRFADFVLARIVKARAPTFGPSPLLPAEDLAWQKTVVLDIIPTPTLSPSQQAAVVREFGMRRHGEGWSWKVPLRRCLAPYFVHAHRLELSAGQAPYRRITLRDPESAREFDFIDD